MLSTNPLPETPVVRIRALGGFLVTTPDAPDGVRTRSRSKPLDLLKLLVANGEDGLAVQQAVDMLWPDAEGDRAQWSFATTLRRLRLLVDGGLVQVHSGRLVLTRDRCWVDVREFADNLASCRESVAAGKIEQANGLLRETLKLYRGPLLQGESDLPLVEEARWKLHGALLDQVRALGGCLQKAGQVEQAIALYREALDTDQGAEWLHQELMHCLLRAGRPSEARLVYERCRRLLQTQFGVKPGPRTEALRRESEGDQTESWRELPSLAVLPFESHLQEDANYAAGIGYDVRTALQKLSGLIVYGLPSVPDGDDDTAPPLQARYVLSGNVRRIGPSIRITATLVDSPTGQQVWAERYDCSDPDLPATMDGIVEEIVTSLHVELIEGEQARIWSRSLRNPQARDLFYQGVTHFWGMTPEQLALARKRFQEVIEMEPDSVFGYGYLAWTHLFEVFHGFSPDPERCRALAAEYCQRALDMDVDGLSLHSLKSHLHLLAGEWDLAIAAGETAMELRPSCSIAFVFMGHTLLYLGRPREAIARIKMAFRLSPLCPPWFYELLGWSYLIIGFHDQAATAARNALQGDPARVESQLLLAAALHAQGRVEEAQDRLETLLRVNPDLDLQAFLAAKPGKGPELLRNVLSWAQGPEQ